MWRIAALVLAATVGLAGAGPTAKNAGIQVNPGVFDPDNTGTVYAAWVTKQGLPDEGKSDHALVLIKATDTSTYSAAGADILSVKGMPADNVYGFDIRQDSYFGAGAPRFNLLTEQGTFHFIGSTPTILGTTTDSRGKVWATVVYDPTDPVQAFPVVPAGSTIAEISIIVDEDTRSSTTGAVILDNINVNGVLSGKPGK